MLFAGKKRRITLMECNNDINSMIDIAKVADLVLLLVDASFGFEMEIFEFLNICQVRLTEQYNSEPLCRTHKMLI
jgi:ribosome biogenesis protein BMS1